MIPAWLHGSSVATDRILVAAWLMWDGEHSAANQLVHSVAITHAEQVDTRMRRIVELIGQRRLCDDDPRWYCDQHSHRPQGMSWDEFREGELEQLDADLRVEADAIAALSVRSAA